MIKFFNDGSCDWEIIPDPNMTKQQAQHIYEMWISFNKHPDKAIPPIAHDLNIDIKTIEGYRLIRDKIQDAVNIITGHHLLLDC